MHGRVRQRRISPPPVCLIGRSAFYVTGGLRPSEAQFPPPRPETHDACQSWFDPSHEHGISGFLQAVLHARTPVAALEQHLQGVLAVERRLQVVRRQRSFGEEGVHRTCGNARAEGMHSLRSTYSICASPWKHFVGVGGLRQKTQGRAQSERGRGTPQRAKGVAARRPVRPLHDTRRRVRIH